MLSLYSKALRFLGQQQKKLFIINIGACDGVTYDETFEISQEFKWNGLYVEPIPDVYKDLIKNLDNGENKFENSAVAETTGTTTMLRINRNAIESQKVHNCFIGMSSIYPPRNGLGKEGDRETVEKYGEKIIVNTITLNDLLTKHNITAFDVLSIDAEGYDYKILKQLDFSRFKPCIIRCEVINLTPEEQTDMLAILRSNGYVAEVYGQNVDAIKEDLYNEVKFFNYKKLPTKKPNKNNITLVTGIFDLGRDNAGEGFKRPFTHYIVKFIELLKALKDYNVVVYIESKYKDLVADIRPTHNTVFRIKEIDEFRSLFPFYNEVSNIRKKDEWLNQAGWLRESTQATMELYNPMVMSKMFFLHDEKVRNHFNTEYFYWIDGGLTNTVHPGYFYKDNVIEKLPSITDKFVFLSFPYETGGEIHGFERNKMNEYSQTKNVEYVCRGGFFGGHEKNISEINGIYYNVLQNTLHNGYMGTEESVFTIISYTHPHLFHRHMIDGNGLVNKFFEDIKNYTPTEGSIIINNNYTGTSLYVVTYNSPAQFEKLIESYLKQPGFITETKNYLLDNSTDLSTTEQYLNICKKYNFEHIKKQNIGICGGRQFVAEHFETTNQKYYMFLEDDMNLYNGSENICKNGFSRYTPNLFYKILKIMDREEYDFLKISFTEFYGDNKTQWAWYNVPQTIREKFFPHKTKLPVQGLDPDAPKTMFTNIKSVEGLSYIEGDIYYCNWPQIVTRNGNKKMFLETKWAHPFEQTWMSYFFQLMKDNKLKSSVLLLSPIEHNRFEFYKSEERREN
jgi:FkbM family methyltransferase